MTLRLLSTFAGIGGFDLAAERAGLATIGQVELDPTCQRVLQRHWPTVPRHDDITTYDARSLRGRVDLVAGGFPCQDLSVAGRRAGLAGGRSGLFYEFARVVDECAPRWVVVENVPGLLSSNGGRDMGAVLGTLGELGYGFAYRVLDAQHFGVPQRRRRVFIVGHLGDGRAPVQVLLEPESRAGDPPPRRTAGTGVAALTAHGVGTCGADDNQAQAGHLLAATLTSGAAARAGVNAPGRRQEDDTNLVTHALTAEGADASEDGTGRGTPLVVGFHFGSHPGAYENRTAALTGRNGDPNAVAIPTTYRKAKRAQTDQDDESWIPDDRTNTLNTFDGGDTRATELVVTDAVRRLTPLECERLQGFPDGWTAGESDSARYRMLGNAVAVPVVEWILRRLVAVDAHLDQRTRTAS